MAFNPDRFVVIDGVQISKNRATRDGLIDEKGRIVKQPAADGPSSDRARSSASARAGQGGKTKATAAEPAADAGNEPAGDAGDAGDDSQGDQEA